VIGVGMTIGVGWGRTLTSSLASFHPPRQENIRVMSLVGGAIETEQSNPVEFSWRMASVLGAECFLFPAPVIVDSAETKRRLIELSGLDRLFTMAASLDLAVLGVGDIGHTSTSVASRMVSKQELKELMALGAVGDVMCNFLDAEGRAVAHPVNARIMSIDLATIRKAGHIVLAGGGAARAPAIAAAIKATRCNTLVTDEAAARKLLATRP
jgi:DNA-binding transcriptional regulator LsrR (DeoR family)